MIYYFVDLNWLTWMQSRTASLAAAICSAFLPFFKARSMISVKVIRRSSTKSGMNFFRKAVHMDSKAIVRPWADFWPARSIASRSFSSKTSSWLNSSTLDSVWPPFRPKKKVKINFNENSKWQKLKFFFKKKLSKLKSDLKRCKKKLNHEITILINLWKNLSIFLTNLIFFC